MIFYQKWLWNIRSRLNTSTFCVLDLYLDMFDQNWSFVYKKWRFWLNMIKYRLKNSKSFSKQNSKLRIHSKPDRNQSKLTVHCSVRSLFTWFMHLIHDDVKLGTWFKPNTQSVSITSQIPILSSSSFLLTYLK